jgi:hypothetical protein
MIAWLRYCQAARMTACKQLRLRLFALKPAEPEKLSPAYHSKNGCVGALAACFVSSCFTLSLYPEDRKRCSGNLLSARFSTSCRNLQVALLRSHGSDP